MQALKFSCPQPTFGFEGTSENSPAFQGVLSKQRTAGLAYWLSAGIGSAKTSASCWLLLAH